MEPDAIRHLDRLEQRHRWLNERIKAKEKVGWETTYDIEERDALKWALDAIKECLGEV